MNDGKDDIIKRIYMKSEQNFLQGEMSQKQRSINWTMMGMN